MVIDWFTLKISHVGITAVGTASANPTFLKADSNTSEHSKASYHNNNPYEVISIAPCRGVNQSKIRQLGVIMVSI